MHCLPDICGQQPPPQRGCLKYIERNKQRCQKYQRCRCVCVGGGEGCRALENVRLFRTTDLSHLPRDTRAALRATGDHELSPRPVLFLVLWGPQTGYKAESPEYQTGRGPLFRQHPSAAVSCPGIHSSPPIRASRVLQENRDVLLHHPSAVPRCQWNFLEALQKSFKHFTLTRTFFCLVPNQHPCNESGMLLRHTEYYGM
jgi:hypothetical protein